MNPQYTIIETDKRIIVMGTVPVDVVTSLYDPEKHKDWVYPHRIIAAIGATSALCHKDEMKVWEAEIEQTAVMKAKEYSPNDESVQWELTWLFGWDAGTSSKTIFCVLASVAFWRETTFNKLGKRPHLPSDPEDFGVCHRLLKRIPDWRARLPEVSERFPEWKPLVDNWDDLTALYLEELPTGACPKLYERMQQLRNAD